MHTLNELKHIADQALCENCRKLYPKLIEPTVKTMLAEFFFDWQGVEAETRFILAKGLGAYKKSPYIFDSEWEDDLSIYSDEIDVGKYEEIRHWLFGTVVKKLEEHRLIGPQLNLLLKDVGGRRNKIHRYKRELPESDRIIFYHVHNLLLNFTLRLRDPTFVVDYATLIADVDKAAKKLLEQTNLQAE